MKRLLLLLFIIPLLLRAQTDTIVSNKITIKNDLLLGISLSGGNKPIYGGSIKSNLSITNNTYEASINTNYVINYTTDNKSQLLLQRREFYNSINISNEISDKCKMQLFSEVENSFLQKINIRYNVGIGPGFKFKRDKYELVISEILLCEKFNSNKLNIPDYFIARASTRLKFVYTVKSFTFSTIHLLQPAVYTQDLSEGKYLIFRSNSRIDFNVTNKVTTGITYDTSYQAYTSYLDKSVKPYDWTTNFFISYKF